MSEKSEPTSEAFPDRTIIYGICGPRPAGIDNFRCADCKKIIKSTGKDWYCAKTYPIGEVKGVWQLKNGDC